MGVYVPYPRPALDTIDGKGRVRGVKIRINPIAVCLADISSIKNRFEMLSDHREMWGFLYNFIKILVSIFEKE